MPKLIDELEMHLDRLVDERMKFNYSSRDQNKTWVYEEFSEWLIKKFKGETNVE